MKRPTWEFDYRPTRTTAAVGSGSAQDLIVATECDVDVAEVVQALGGLADSVRSEVVLSSFPLFWARVRTNVPIEIEECEMRLAAASIPVRYVTSTQYRGQGVAPLLRMDGCPPRRASRWKARTPDEHRESSDTGDWFLGTTGLNVRRSVCGTGVGTRLAVIDDDAGQLERLDLDAAVTVGVSAPPRGSAHCATLVAWATRAKRNTGRDTDDAIFTGVAPDASVRAYFIPKGTEDSLWLPLAIIRAVDDGADVVLCATNVDGRASPMLDDALTVAWQLGRGGRGTAVVMPCTRETSSPEGSVHASLSLGMGEPASDPRVFCISPSGKNGNWFLWRDRRGRLRPFANRAPGARWMAPGDDVPYPFGPAKRLAHAESSGAAAMAAGALLLLLGVNPDLSLAEVDAILCRTVSPVPGDEGVDWSLVADRCDLLPLGRDPDGHNAKHGYGRLDATAACLVAQDPVSAALVYVGEVDAARKYLGLRQTHATLSALYSQQLGRWAAARLLSDATARHALCSLARGVRLLAADPTRRSAQVPGASVRQLAVAVRLLASGRPMPREPGAATELRGLAERIAEASRLETTCKQLEAELYTYAYDLWPRNTSASQQLRIALDADAAEANRIGA